MEPNDPNSEDEIIKRHEQETVSKMLTAVLNHEALLVTTDMDRRYIRDGQPRAVHLFRVSLIKRWADSWIREISREASPDEIKLVNGVMDNMIEITLRPTGGMNNANHRLG